MEHGASVRTEYAKQLFYGGPQQACLHSADHDPPLEGRQARRTENRVTPYELPISKSFPSTPTPPSPTSAVAAGSPTAHSTGRGPAIWSTPAPGCPSWRVRRDWRPMTAFSRAKHGNCGMKMLGHVPAALSCRVLGFLWCRTRPDLSVLSLELPDTVELETNLQVFRASRYGSAPDRHRRVLEMRAATAAELSIALRQFPKYREHDATRVP